MLKNLALGRAAELRVASELLLMGNEVFLTMVDSGADLVLGNGKRIQVKAAHRVVKGKRDYADYTFSFKSWRRQQGKYEAHKLESIDFIVLWAVDDNRFFVVPSQEIRGQYSVQIGLRRRAWSKYMAYEGKWELLKS